MKHAILVTAVVLCVTSAANATLSFEDSALTVSVNSTIDFNIMGDTAANIDWLVGNDPGKGRLTNVIAINPPPGVDVSATEFSDGWWEISVTDNDPDTWDIIAGVQFRGTLTAYGETGTYSIYLYDSGWTSTGLKDTLTFTIVPEPMTIALLGLGGILLLRKKR